MSCVTRDTMQVKLKISPNKYKHTLWKILNNNNNNNNCIYIALFPVLQQAQSALQCIIITPTDRISLRNILSFPGSINTVMQPTSFPNNYDRIHPISLATQHRDTALSNIIYNTNQSFSLTIRKMYDKSVVFITPFLTVHRLHTVHFSNVPREF